MPTLKKNETIMSYSVIYPIMQCIDVLYTKADVILAEHGQKKIYSLLKYLSPYFNHKIDKKGINFIYVKQSHDILGKPLNVSTSKTRISFHETEESLKQKIQKMYAPEKEICQSGKVNALLETFKYSVFPWVSEVHIKSTTKTLVKYSKYKDFEKDYFSGIIHPNDVKNTLFYVLINRIKCAKEKLKNATTNWIGYFGVTMPVISE